MSASPAKPPPEGALQVSQLNARVRRLLESAHPTVWLEGEISNFRRYQASGHWYFSLKDDRSQVAAAMFRGRNRLVRFEPADGVKVLVRGQVTLYEPRGTYQVLVERMEPLGAGDLHAAFEALKERLAAEGLFQADRKRPIPLLPRRIGVVTSREGAAFRDILRVLRRRHGRVTVLLAPTRVQGQGAAAEIAAALERVAAAPGDVDVVIVGRGGGSLEDLWAFNEEVVARAIAACPRPVISAVGHEIDHTIADLAADLRAPTPSAAAELVAASAAELAARLAGHDRRLAAAVGLTLARLRAHPAVAFPRRAPRAVSALLRRSGQRVDEIQARLLAAVRQSLARERQRTAVLTARLAPRSLRSGLAAQSQRLRSSLASLRRAMEQGARARRLRLERLAGRLHDLSPLAVLDRGYALARLADTGEVLRDARQARPGQEIEVRLGRGGLGARVESIRPADEPA